MQQPILHLFAGRIASGKSRLAAGLAQAPRTVLIEEDRWLARLYPDEMGSPEGYLRRAPLLRATIGPHVAQLLRAGATVVLDVPLYTRGERAWARTIVEAAGHPRHVLHWLDTPDALCRARLALRHAAGDHPFHPVALDYDRFAALFEPPRTDEGLILQVHRPDGDDGTASPARPTG